MDNVKNIVTDVDELSKWCVEIDPKKQGKLVQQIVVELKATMREKNLLALTAPQIGYDYRIFCVKFGDNNYRSFINPMIENNSNLTFVPETCSSIPDKRYVMPRFGKVKLDYMTPLGKVECATFMGVAAYKIQHCIEHLNGQLVSDMGLEIDELFDNASEEERAEVIKMYADSLDVRAKSLRDAVEQDPELQKIDEAARFVESVREGKTKLEKIS